MRAQTYVNTLWFSLLTMCCILVSVASAEILPESIVGVWLLDEGSGQTANDITGKSSNGTLQSGAQWVAGMFDGAISFDGKDDYLEIPLPDVFSNIPNNDFTIAFWINIRNIAGSGTVWTRVLEARHDNINYLQFDIQINDGELGINLVSEGAETTLMVDVPVSADRWYHVVSIWTAADSDLGLYLDGVPQTTPGTVPASPGTEKTLDIGRRSDGSADTYFDGLIDEFAVFGIALVEEDIQTIMEQGLKDIASVTPSGKLAAVWGRLRADSNKTR